MVIGILVGAIVPTVGLFAGYRLGRWMDTKQAN